MSNVEVTLKPWYEDLCQYYGVSPEEALKLGTRATGRKPDLPGSSTCKPVSNMTLEDIWESKDRNNIQDVFNFYKDQGAWSAFRQCVRHKDLVQLHVNFVFPHLSQGHHICEYGSGVAPYMNTLMQCLTQEADMDISIADVDCEHFTFAQWRLDKIKRERGLKVNLTSHTIQVDELPKFHKPLDLVTIFEVLEHTPDPVAVVKNIHDQMNENAVLIENFILAADVLEAPEFDGPDLRSAALLRDDCLSYIRENFDLINGHMKDVDENPNATRMWRKKPQTPVLNFFETS